MSRAKRIVDPVREGREAEAFWAVARENVNTIRLMEVGLIQRSEVVHNASKARYRLTYLCADCTHEHRVEGSFEQCAEAFQALILTGNRSVSMETIEYAMQRDIDEADDIVFWENPDRPKTPNTTLDDILKRKS